MPLIGLRTIDHSLTDARLRQNFVEVIDWSGSGLWVSTSVPTIKQILENTGISAMHFAMDKSAMNAPMRIFVSIASYRDPLLRQTIKSCCECAANPANLSLGVVDQSPEPISVCSANIGASQLRYIHLHQTYGRGPCFARSIAAGLWQGEDYFLQIDAHTVFDRGWDQKLIAMYESISTINPRSILTSYPCGFEMKNDTPLISPQPGKTIALQVRPDSDFDGDSPVLRFHGVTIADSRPVPGYHVGAGCLFTRGFWLQEVPTDPHLYFEGEEQNLAVRSWTTGWDIYHAADIPLYHLYASGPKSSAHWAEADDALRSVRWWTLREQANLRLRRLLFDGETLGAYGLGTVRSLADFAAFSGINYPVRQIARRSFK